MIRQSLLACLLLIASVASVRAQDQSADWDAADGQVRRLAPAAFPELPKKITQALQQRGCTIPQTYGDLKPHNVIRGRFARPDQQDWAVLCSVNRVSSILVFWGGSDNDVSSINASPDKMWLQGTGDGKIGYSRAVEAVGEKYILDHYRAYGGNEPPPIDHEGINDIFVGKASVVHYFHGGKWLQLTGAD